MPEPLSTFHNLLIDESKQNVPIAGKFEQRAIDKVLGHHGAQ